jgi:DNA-binding transcriptional LysR family regulator
MELQRLRHILCVADEGHFGRAAQRLGMAQPPLSQSIRRSERELGIALFERTPKGAVLTAAGRACLPEARVAVAAAERATAQARSAVRRQPAGGRRLAGTLGTAANVAAPRTRGLHSSGADRGLDQ